MVEHVGLTAPEREPCGRAARVERVQALRVRAVDVRVDGAQHTQIHRHAHLDHAARFAALLWRGRRMQTREAAWLGFKIRVRVRVRFRVRVRVMVMVRVRVRVRGGLAAARLPTVSSGGEPPT